MHKVFGDLLHRYKVEAFKIAHGNESVSERTREILEFTEGALNNAYTYHFHEDPSPERVEIFNMIKNFTVEAIMPPVVEKLTRRMVAIERQHALLVKLVEDLLETLSKQAPSDAVVG